jgi:hypothetical protein
MNDRNTSIEELAARRTAEVRHEAGLAEELGDAGGAESGEETREPVEGAVVERSRDVDEHIARANEVVGQAEEALRERAAREGVRVAVEAMLDDDLDTAAAAFSRVLDPAPGRIDEAAVDSVVHQVRMSDTLERFRHDHRAMLADPAAARAVDEAFAQRARGEGGALKVLTPSEFGALLEESAASVTPRARPAASSISESSPEDHANAIREIARSRGQTLSGGR